MPREGGTQWWERRARACGPALPGEEPYILIGLQLWPGVLVGLEPGPDLVSPVGPVCAFPGPRLSWLKGVCAHRLTRKPGASACCLVGSWGDRAFPCVLRQTRAGQSTPEPTARLRGCLTHSGSRSPWQLVPCGHPLEVMLSSL